MSKDWGQGILNDELAYLDNEGAHTLGKDFKYGENQDLSSVTVFNWNDEEVS